MSPQATSVFPFVDTHNFVWDVGLLDWVKETQSGGGGGGTVDQGSGGLSPWLVTAASWPLPTGAATALRQDTGNTSLASIDGKITTVNTGAVTVSTALPAGANSIGAVTQGGSWSVGVTGTVLVDGSGVTQPISAAVLPLPSGASTVLRQDTGNTSLASIDTKLTSPLTVQATNLDIRDLTFASDKVDASGSAVSVSSSTLPSNAAQETGGNLATIATNTTGVALDASIQALNALVSALTANGVVATSDPNYEADETQPLSLTQLGRLRVVTAVEEPIFQWNMDSAFDSMLVSTAKGFALANTITVDSVWE